MSDTALEIHDLTVAYDKKPVLYGIDLKIPTGKLIGVIGPNGAGKTTLIKAIMGIVKSSAGWVKIFDKNVKKNLKRLGYVPQRESVDWDFPVNVNDVVMMGCYGRLGLFKRPGKKERETVKSCLEKVEMTPYANRQISNLSGGQQQRVFLARALAQESDLYLMDEPFAGVDAATEKAIVKLLTELKNKGKTILVVHHDLATAKEYFDQLIMLNMRLVAYGETEKTFTESNLHKTYGGKLTILSDVIDKMAQK